MLETEFEFGRVNSVDVNAQPNWALGREFSKR